MDTQVFDQDGRAVTAQQGELVCTTPFPSMPLYFWNDADGKKYHNAYFARYQNVWHHGDFALQTSRGGFFVLGRSDATLNPSGVRLGTAEYYALLDCFAAVADSVVVGVRDGDNEKVALFVVCKPGYQLTEQLIADIKAKIRSQLSPKHLPAFITEMSAIPYNINFKKMEILVKQLIDDEHAKVTTALQNPESVELYREWGRQHRAKQAPRPKL